MILLRLLRAGKTLVGVGDGERSYRLPQKGGLPRFKSKKNPFRATTVPEKPRRSPVEAADEESGNVLASAETTGRADVAAAPLSVREAVRTEATNPGDEAASVAARGKRWLNRFKGMVRTRPATYSAPEVNSRPAQSELRLESVRVVRNDLSESDIEIVPRQKTLQDFVNRVPGSVAAAAARSASETVWSRVSARIFGPDNVR
jgi:hypothetical protein